MTSKKRGTFAVVLVLFLAILIAPGHSQTAGCYVYPQASEDLYCVPDVLDSEAQADCDEHSGCNMAEHFLPGSDCSSLDECNLITCSVDCQRHAQEVCREMGGEIVPEEQYDFYCSPGCCKIADRFCQFGLNRYQCQQRASQMGQRLTDPNVNYDNQVGMTLEQCNTEYCRVIIGAASLEITVIDQAGEPLSGVSLILEGTAIAPGQTNRQGTYTFAGLTPSTYSVSIHKAGYRPARASITLAPEAAGELSFTLTESEGALVVSGTVKSSMGEILPGATVSWTGPLPGRATTDEAGNYQTGELPLGRYTFTASKIGYTAQERADDLTEAIGVVFDFVLEERPWQGIRGTTYVDFNDNALVDTMPPETSEQTYGVKIYLDGVFKGYSQFPNSNYELSIDVKEREEEHTISATYQDFQYPEETFTISPGESLEKNLLLTTYRGECDEDGPNPLKAVATFSANHRPGKKEILLAWAKPCPEVIAYQIERKAGGEVLESFEVSPAQNQFIDDSEELIWGGTYTYSIKAVYDYPGEVPAKEASITLGSEYCEDRYHEDTLWERFCLTGSAEFRKTVFTCDETNNLKTSNCGELDGPGESYYCAQTSPRNAECMNAGACNLFSDPFGLYYSPALCYGSSDPEEAANYCVYDYSNTIVNQCRSCAEINSCFEYQSREACTFNNCLGSTCAWVEGADNADDNTDEIVDYSLLNLTLPGLVSGETGHGYCVEEDYSGDDTCSLCGPEISSVLSTAVSAPIFYHSALFENYYCTSEICSSLGRCFSDNKLTACTSCGEFPSRKANCYTYNSEMECTGGQGVVKDVHGQITGSEDQCGWEKCLWLGVKDSFAPGSCVKDGNGDRQDDCASFSSRTEQLNCQRDVSPPKTSLVPPEVQTISQAYPNITFLGRDDFHEDSSQRSVMGLLGYCLLSADPRAPSVCSEDDFVSSQTNYPGSQSQEILTLNLIESAYLQNKQVDGETYRLLFYSEDKYRNREDVRETYIFLDNVPPQFEINQGTSTSGEITRLTVYLEGLNEPMGCSFTLTGLFPRSAPQSQEIAEDVPEKTVLFADLPGIVYELQVSCQDRQGNVNKKSKRFVFDQEERIDVLQPALGQVMSRTEISFRASTAVGAACALYLTATNEKVADFVADGEGKLHETGSVPGFIEGDYTGDYKIACQELLTGEIFEDYYAFSVDFTPPGTQVILQEGSREERPSSFGWEEFFISEVQIDFECLSEGFGCEKTFYCLGDECSSIRHADYQEYTVTLTLAESARLCYYSTDVANNPVYSPVCGKIVIEGYGIELENPPLHFYQGEQWGVSNKPKFDWQFTTKVPTSECRFDFSENFAYENVPGFKVLTPVAGGGQSRYIFPNFPEGAGVSAYAGSGSVKKVYVKCRNYEGELGPEEKMNLEFDPTAPEIKAAYAEPALLTEGNAVALFVETDDKTLCRYSDAGHTEYRLMNYAFPGEEEKILDEEHRAEFNVGGFTGLVKNYELNTVCRNGAADYSELKKISFVVDYTQLGGISSLWPEGDYFTVKEITGNIQTTKEAVCEYKQPPQQPQQPSGNATGNANASAGSFVPLQVTGGRSHAQSLSSSVSPLAEGFHRIPVRCTMGDHVVENTFTFTIDMSSPVISSVNDGNFTCGQENIKVMAYTTAEESLAAYSYQVYDLGAVISFAEGNGTNNGTSVSTNVSGIAATAAGAGTSVGVSAGVLVYENTVAPELPILVPTAGLISGHKYKIKIRAQDKANNWGELGESDGVIVVPQDYSVCRADLLPPEISLVIDDNASCTANLVEMHCEDNLGCALFRYQQSFSAGACQANQSYNGQKLSFGKNGWLCYYAADYAGNNISSLLPVNFPDKDGDGVADRCDQCSNTKAGEMVDMLGCAYDEIPEGEEAMDTDGDGLPDRWERIYDAFNCPLNFASLDSDNNGLSDGEEDYDGDGSINFAEYQGRRDPCSADVLPEKEKEEWEEELEKREGEEKEGEKAPPPPEEEFDLLAWLFLLLGLLMVSGGAGYLIYYYRYAPSAKRKEEEAGLGGAGLGIFRREGGKDEEEKKPEGVSFGQQFQARLMKAKKAKTKEKERRDFFGGFGKKPGIRKIVERYVEPKEEAKPAGKAREAGVFSQLESIAKGGRGRKIPAGEEAKDIFAKLKKMAKQK